MTPNRWLLAQDGRALEVEAETDKGVSAKLRVLLKAKRPKSWNDAKELGIRFASETNGGGDGVALVPALRSSDSKLRHAAFAAAIHAQVASRQVVAQMNQCLIDCEPQTRLMLMDAVQSFKPSQVFLFDQLVHIAFWERQPQLRQTAADSLSAIIESQRAGPTPALIDKLRNLKNELLQKDSPYGGSPQHHLASALLQQIVELDNSISDYERPTIAPAAAPISAYNRLVSPWFEPRKAVVALILAGVIYHSLYLVMFVFFPGSVFRAIYSEDLPIWAAIFVSPWYLRSLERSARTVLSTLTSFSETLAMRNIDLLDHAYRRLKAKKREVLIESLATAIKSLNTDALKLQAMRMMKKLHPERAQQLQSYSPEEPEITAARKFMAKALKLSQGTYTRPYVQISHHLAQATTISGDFYDWIPRADGSMAVYMVDVSGHGVAASLQAMQVYCALRAVRWGLLDAKSELIDADRLFRELYGNFAVTMNFLEIDFPRGKVRYANAGMPWVQLWRKDASESKELKAVGDYVGDGYTVSDRQPAVAEAEVGVGDLLIMYSDGVRDALDKNRRKFGDSGICSAVASVRHLDTEDIALHIMQEVQSYSGKDKPDDDQSLLLIKVMQVGTSGEAPASEAIRNYKFVSHSETQMHFTFTKTREWASDLLAISKNDVIPFIRRVSRIPAEATNAEVVFREAFANSILHGSDMQNVVTVKIECDEQYVTFEFGQQREWHDWDTKLNALRKNELEGNRAKVQKGELKSLEVNGTIYIAMLCDAITCWNNGRRLALKVRKESIQ